MVRLITLLFLLFVLYLGIKASNKQPEDVYIMHEPSIITVEELLPMGTE
jgi:hypothetical protein